MKKFLTAAEIGRLENVSNMTATRWVRKGFFPNARKVGKSFRVPLSDYHHWRESTKLSPTLR
jgi:predicted DNA-binding transcriptional regulator AlpA